jgi:hypothetical protein
MNVSFRIARLPTSVMLLDREDLLRPQGNQKLKRKITQLPRWRILKTRNGHVTDEEIIMQRGSQGRNNMVESEGLGTEGRVGRNNKQGIFSMCNNEATIY